MRTRTSLPSPVVALTCVLLVSPPSAAAAAENRAAQALITHGIGLRREAKSAEALVAFQRAHALAPSPRTLGHMGLVEASLERWTDAETHLMASMASSDDIWVRKNRTFLDQALAVSQSHIGEISVSGQEGAAVTVAGRMVGTLPRIPNVRLGEGVWLVTATAPGWKQFVTTVTVEAGLEQRVSITLDPVEVKIDVPIIDEPVLSIQPADPRPPLSRNSRAGAALVAAGAGLLAWGVVWIAVDGDDRCSSGLQSGPSCGRVYDTATAGWFLTGVGVAAVAGGALVVYRSKATGSDVSLSLAPASLMVGGHF
jgi:hypothetical protein